MAQDGDLIEHPVDGYIIDVVREPLLIEIQTKNFGAMKRKLATLLPQHPIHLIHPIAQEKWILKLPKNKGDKFDRRKSPKRGNIYELFREMLRIPNLMNDPNFSLEVLLIQEEEVRRFDGKKGWRRRGWVIEERRLLDIVDSHLFESKEDFSKLLPPELPAEFTTAVLAKTCRITRNLAQKMAYTLRHMGVIEPVGKDGRSILYKISNQ